MSRVCLRLAGLQTKIALPAVAHAPNGLVTVFTDKQAAVFGDGDSHRAAPHFSFGRDETGHEIFVFVACLAGGMVKRHTHNFVAGAFHPVPRAVERGEDVAFVFGRKLLTQVK